MGSLMLNQKVAHTHSDKCSGCSGSETSTVPDPGTDGLDLERNHPNVQRDLRQAQSSS